MGKWLSQRGYTGWDALPYLALLVDAAQHVCTTLALAFLIKCSSGGCWCPTGGLLLHRHTPLPASCRGRRHRGPCRTRASRLESLPEPRRPPVRSQRRLEENKARRLAAYAS